MFKAGHGRNSTIQIIQISLDRRFANVREPFTSFDATRSSVAWQVWNGLRMDDAPGTNLAAGTNLA